MTWCRIFSTALFAACVATASPATADEYRADDLYATALQLGAAGMRAKFRSKRLTVSGIFHRFSDLQVGDTVSVYFSQALDSSWTLTCSFPRDDTAAYDRFALMAPGTPITAVGTFNDARDIFFLIHLDPCKVL